MYVYVYMMCYNLRKYYKNMYIAALSCMSKYFHLA